MLEHLSECHGPGCSLLELPGKKTFSWENDFLEPMLWGIFLIKRLTREDAAHCGWYHLWAGGPGCTGKQTEQVNKQRSFTAAASAPTSRVPP